MKLANLLTSLLLASQLLAKTALADDASVLRIWIAEQPTRDTGALVQLLAARSVTGSSNVISIVTRATPFEARREDYVRNQAQAAGIVATNTFAVMEQKWDAYVAAGATAAVMRDRASDKARWFAFYADIRDLAASGQEQITVTNSVPILSAPLWQQIGLSHEPKGAEIEAVQQ